MASGDNFGHLYKEVKAGNGNLTFTVPMRAYCNWTPGVVNLKASRCYGSGGGHESWRWNYGFRYLNCSGSDGQRIIQTNLDGSNPGTGYLVESFGSSTNYYTFTFIMNGRNNMIAEVEMIAFGGIYL
jgi:putative hemolysin